MQKTPKPKEQGGKSQKFEGNHNNHPVWTTKPQSPYSILQPYPNPPSLIYHPHYTPPSYNRTFLQLNKCEALLNGPHFWPASAPAAAAASDPVTNAPQKRLK